jgi:hypothetical protein
MLLTYRAAQSLLRFLDSSPVPNAVNLYVLNGPDALGIAYYSQDAQGIKHTLCSTHYRKAASKALWQVLEEQGLVNHSLYPDGNYAELDPAQQRALREYLKLQCMVHRLLCLSPVVPSPDYDVLYARTYPTATADLPDYLPVGSTWQEACPAPHRLLEWVKQAVASLNDDVYLSLMVHLAGRQIQLFRENKGLQQLSEVKNHVCLDGVFLSQLSEQHFRPFTWAGLWIELPEAPAAPLRAKVALHDTRRANCSHNAEATDNFTDQACLNQGVEHLYLNSTLRSWVLATGEPHPTRKGAYFVQATKLKLKFRPAPNLVKKRLEWLGPFNHLLARTLATLKAYWVYKPGCL